MNNLQQKMINEKRQVETKCENDKEAMMQEHGKTNADNQRRYAELNEKANKAQQELEEKYKEKLAIYNSKKKEKK